MTEQLKSRLLDLHGGVLRQGCRRLRCSLGTLLAAVESLMIAAHFRERNPQGLSCSFQPVSRTIGTLNLAPPGSHVSGA